MRKLFSKLAVVAEDGGKCRPSCGHNRLSQAHSHSPVSKKRKKNSTRAKSTQEISGCLLPRPTQAATPVTSHDAKLSHTGRASPNSDLALQPYTAASHWASVEVESPTPLRWRSDSLPRAAFLTATTVLPTGDVIPPAAVAPSRHINRGLRPWSASTSAFNMTSAVLFSDF